MQSLEWSNDLQHMFRQNKSQASTIRKLSKSEETAVQEVEAKSNRIPQVYTFWE
jgi:hypothetical protein